MRPPWTPPTIKLIRSRPLALLGAGVLGSRIACVFAAAGYNVNIRDPSKEARKKALDFLKTDIPKFASLADSGRPFGKCEVYSDVESAVKDAWLVCIIYVSIHKPGCLKAMRGSVSG